MFAIFMIGAILLANAVNGQSDVCNPDDVQLLLKMGEHFDTIVNVIKLAEEKVKRCGPDHCIRFHLHKDLQDIVNGAKAFNGNRVDQSIAVPALFAIAEVSANLMTKAMSVCRICDRCATKPSCASPKPQYGFGY